MALNQRAALEALRGAAGEVIEASLCEVQGAWLALVNTVQGKRLAYAVQGEGALDKLWKDVEKTIEAGKVQVSVMQLNANNAAVVRRYVKWAAPKACGSKGASLGFSDWLGEADAVVTSAFGKRHLKPVLVDFTPEDSEALQRNFLEAVDTATWGVLEAGYREGYGANAAGLKTEEEIVKALLYGYSMIGFDCSDKINLEIEKLSDEAVDKRFEQFNDTFRAAVHASYLNAEFKAGSSKITFSENELHRIVLEYGEAIMHIQFIYNSYLKNTPWDIDFELSLSKPGKVLTPQEHYLIANELQRNGIKLSAICLDGLKDGRTLSENLQLHCEIADTFGYRLSFANADIVLADSGLAMKYLKGKVHFKLNNVLWLSAVRLAAAQSAPLYDKLCVLAGTDGSDEGLLAASYKTVLNPKTEDNMAAEMKAFIAEHKQEYVQQVLSKVEAFIKQL